MKSLEQLKILVVEDHHFQRITLVKMASCLNVERVDSVSDGKQAIEKIAQYEFDIIICDLMMPNMDGLAVLRAIKTLSFSGAIIISSAMDKSLHRAVKNLAYEYKLNLLGTLTKPASKVSLTQLFTFYCSQNSVKQQQPICYQFSQQEIDSAILAGQFVPFFQPQVDFNTGELYGLECLVRWQHPTKGIISPFYFLDYMEKNGLLVDLTERLFEKSIKQLDLLPEEIRRTRLSLNLSPDCISNDLLGKLLLQYKEKGVSRPITLEVTESSMIAEPAIALENLTRLRMHGFKIAIDDFGTGYSSMKQLSYFPFNEFKLDKSFIQDCLTDINCQLIVESSLKLAKKLGLITIAEGVESKEQWLFLQELGFDVCQGYFSARPMPAVELPQWYNNWQSQVPHALAGVRS